MDTRALIIAGGEGTRWNNYLGIPKHLLTIDGQTLIERIVKQLKENGINDIYIVGPDDDRYKINNSKLVQPKTYYKNLDSDKMLSSMDLWSLTSRTMILFGDTFFTNKAIKKIIDFKKMQFTVYARFNPSLYTKKRYGEIFAQSFYPIHIQNHYETLLYISQLHLDNIINRSAAWEHYRAISGARGERVGIHRQYKNAIIIDDFTDDFDGPSDYDRFLKRYESRENLLFKIQTIIPSLFNRHIYSVRYKVSYYMSVFFKL